MDISSASISNALQTSLQGLQKSSDGLTEHAENIRDSSLQSGDPSQQNPQTSTLPSTTDSLVGLVEDKNLAGANIKALQTENEVLGSIIDIKV
ncbi:methyl-accepting chemotaxis protein [Catenovulum agarivorans DS-2]|uniref:Methyl-accepting chemotaxis protein n=1 Tax=Catenovulum agarivorans DS-2 TaxID=1328313 RepID=W7QV30_9ALTE|nr:hypothetical protein [Catenovulum agarivorans]EWH11563.1 methyl-accepting chemotaxis protein [Catenovulum agarivorans DS-2]